jgi:hypothetical protein
MRGRRGTVAVLCTGFVLANVPLAPCAGRDFGKSSRAFEDGDSNPKPCRRSECRSIMNESC